MSYRDTNPIFFSALLTTSTSETDIGNALLQLPVFHSSESLTVTAAPKANGAGIVLTITFSSKRGKLKTFIYNFKINNLEKLNLFINLSKYTYRWCSWSSIQDIPWIKWRDTWNFCHRAEKGGTQWRVFYFEYGWSDITFVALRFICWWCKYIYIHMHFRNFCYNLKHRIYLKWMFVLLYVLKVCLKE